MGINEKIYDRMQNKSVIIPFTLIMALLALLLGIGVLNLPAWPFLIFVFYFIALVGMAGDKLVQVAAGGVAGLAIRSMTNGLVVTPGNIMLMSFAIIIATAALTLFLHFSRRVQALDTLRVLVFVFFTYSAGAIEPVAFLPALCSYLIAVLLTACIVVLLRNTAFEDWLSINFHH